MKALTIRQPYAAAVMWAGKTVENRAVLLKHRGPLAIHSALARWVGQDPRVDMVTAALRLNQAASRFLEQPRGVILGLVDVADVHRAEHMCCTPGWGDSTYRGKPAVHLVLERPRPLRTPVPARGALGLWTPPDDIAAAVKADLAAQAREDALDDQVDAWHDGAGHGQELHEFLGLSWDEYTTWVETGHLPDPTRQETP